MTTTRRSFLATAACATAALAAPRITRAQASSPFKVSVITGEISEDFDHACSVASKEFGMQWVELRTMWGKNIVDLGADDLARVQSILSKYNMRVTDTARPLFTVDCPGAPRSKSR